MSFSHFLFESIKYTFIIIYFLDFDYSKWQSNIKINHDLLKEENKIVNRWIIVVDRARKTNWICVIETNY